MATVSLLGDVNMATVRSCENRVNRERIGCMMSFSYCRTGFRQTSLKTGFMHTK